MSILINSKGQKKRRNGSTLPVIMHGLREAPTTPDQHPTSRCTQPVEAIIRPQMRLLHPGLRYSNETISIPTESPHLHTLAVLFSCSHSHLALATNLTFYSGSQQTQKPLYHIDTSRSPHPRALAHSHTPPLLVAHAPCPHTPPPNPMPSSQGPSQSVSPPPKWPLS